MTNLNWDGIDKIVYINLNRRKDCRVRVTHQLKALGGLARKLFDYETIEHNLGYIWLCQIPHSSHYKWSKKTAGGGGLFLRMILNFIRMMRQRLA